MKAVLRWRYGSEHERIGSGTLAAHEEHLRRVVPPERLFWYNVKEWWEPLRILGVPLPDRPFPHNN